MAGVPNVTDRKPRPNSIRRKVWQSMRVKHIFTIPYLCITSGADSSNVSKFVQRLVEHGYVVVHQSNKRGWAGSYQAWRLVKDIGPDYPMKCERCGNVLGAPCIKEE